MAIKALPNRRLFMPKLFELQMRGNVFMNQSPMNGVVRTAEIPGDSWVIRMEYSFRKNDEYHELRAFWNSLRGPAHVLRCWHLFHPEPRGTLRGSPTLSVAAVEGANQITILGGAGSTLLPGDFVGVTLNNSKLQTVEVESATGTGTITATITPPLRRAALVDSTVVWQRPTIDFLLQTAPYIPHTARYSGGFSIEAVEFV